MQLTPLSTHWAPRKKNKKKGTIFFGHGVHCILHFKTKDCGLIPNRHKKFLFSPNHPDWLCSPASLPINGHQQLLRNLPACCTFNIIYMILMCTIIQRNETFHCVHQFDRSLFLNTAFYGCNTTGGI